MSLKEMDQFNEIIEKIKELIFWYENDHIENTKTRIFLASGDSFSFKLTRDKIAHLLGVKTDFLVASGHFRNTSSYEVLKELCQNQIRISGLIKDGIISLNDIFSKHIKEKLESFKSNNNISLANSVLVCKYDREKAIFQGQTPRNCDYIIFKIDDDDSFLELDLKINDKVAVPVSNRMFSDENEASDSLKSLLKDQSISFITSLILNNDYFTKNRKIYLNESEKLLKLEVLENYKLKYKSNIDVVGDCKYGYKQNRINKKEGLASYNVYEIIINCITESKIIDKTRLYDLTEQDLALIDAINDNLVNNSANNKHQESYSNLQKQIVNLVSTNDILTNKNNELQTELVNTQTKLNTLNVEHQKTLVLVNDIKTAFNKFDK